MLDKTAERIRRSPEREQPGTREMEPSGRKDYDDSDPESISYYALTIATVEGKVVKAAKLCHEAWKQDRDNPVIYHNLGKIYILAGRKKEALKVLRNGLRKSNGRDTGIAALINSLGKRRRPVLSMLPRENRANKFLGSIKAKFQSSLS